MTASELMALRKEVKKYIDHADERVVRMIYAMLEIGAANADYQLTPEQEAELDARMEKYKKGLITFSSMEDARARISSRINTTP